jgi:hypothetical protein
MRQGLLALAGLAVAIGLPLSAQARPCGQDVACPPILLEGPLPNPFPAGDPLGSPHDTSGGRPVGALAEPTVEEEYFFSGAVDVFNYDAFPASRGAAPGDRLIAVKLAQPYKTRMVVRRPASAAAFSGDVVIESFNSTAGFDTAPSWLPTAE